MSKAKPFFFQWAAFDLLLADSAEHFPSGFCIYRTLCAIGSDTKAEPGPRRDGKVFEVSTARIAQMANKPIAEVIARMRDFTRLGLMDAFSQPEDALCPFTIRLRTIGAHAVQPTSNRRER